MTYHIVLFPLCKRTVLSERPAVKDFDIEHYRRIPQVDPHHEHRVHEHAAHGPPPARTHAHRPRSA